jgi:hypothetical protein
LDITAAAKNELAIPCSSSSSSSSSFRKKRRDDDKRGTLAGFESRVLPLLLDPDWHAAVGGVCRVAGQDNREELTRSRAELRAGVGDDRGSRGDGASGTSSSGQLLKGGQYGLVAKRDKNSSAFSTKPDPASVSGAGPASHGESVENDVSVSLAAATRAAGEQQLRQIRRGPRILHHDSEENNGGQAWLRRPAALWCADDQLLAAGAVVVARLRAAVLAQAGFTCSAGLAHSKTLAKLASAMNKPARSTLVPRAMVGPLFGSLPLGRLRGFGGKLGAEICATFGCATVGDLRQVGLGC